MGFAIEASLVCTYTSGLQSYLTFCKIHNLPMTPTPESLSLFVVYMCAHIQPSSVCAYLSGICHSLEDAFPEVHAHRNSHLVTCTTIVFTAFWALLRLGEMVVPDSIALRSLRKQSLHYLLSITDASFTFFLPTHKADWLYKGNKIMVLAVGGKFCGYAN